MINFKLKDIDKIAPFGQEPKLSQHWFGLTDGYLWLTFGDQTIYQYSEESRAFFGPDASLYNDYYLARFIEDFTDLFAAISEEVPDPFFISQMTLTDFFKIAGRWFGDDDDDDAVTGDNDEEYNGLISWVGERTLFSPHLTGGPRMYFFRNGDRIKIVWESGDRLDNGVKIWSADSGFYEMQFDDFVKMVDDFGVLFFNEMDKQVAIARDRNWGMISIDINRLVKEHSERRAGFQSKLMLLKQPSGVTTDWAAIALTYGRLKGKN